MNVLFVSNDPKLFIADSAVRARMRTYAEAIGNLHILSRGPADAESPVREELSNTTSLTIHRSTTSRVSMFLKMPKEIRTIIEQESIEVVSAQDPFEHGLVAVLGVRGTSAKLHIQIHTDFLAPLFVHGFSHMALLNRIRVALSEYVIPRAQSIRVVSGRVRNRLLAHYGTRIPKPVVLPVPLAMREVPDASFPENTFTHKILVVARLEPEKRIQDVLYALTGVHNRYPDAGVFIVGEGREKKKLEKLIEHLEIQDSVVFIEYRTDVRGLMPHADIFLQTSAYEGYGLTLLEAALAGIPIVTTDVGLVGELLKKDEDVTVVPFANPITIAHAIVNLLSNPEHRNELAAHAQEVAREYVHKNQVTPQDIARNLHDVYASTT